MRFLKSPPPNNMSMIYLAVPYKIVIIKDLLPILGSIPILL